MPGPSSDGGEDELERARDGIIGIHGSASVKSWFPRFRQAQGLLESNEAMLRSIVRTIPFDLWAVDTEGRFVLQNEASVERVGLRIGRKADDLPISGGPVEPFAGNVARVLAGETLRGERRAADGSGERWALEIIAPVLAEHPDERGKACIEGAIGISIDISDRKLAEERLKRANEALEAAVAERTEELRRANADLAERNRRLGSTLDELRDSREALLRSERLATTARMAGRVAHELNSPLGALLSAVNGMEELLAGGLVELVDALASLDPEERAFCAKLVSAGAASAKAEPQALVHRAERRSAEEALAARGVADPLAIADLALDITG
ncbi:MAG: PAS domain S-box protein, partial [Spirochaetaceae bacterium]|nr:PAS domain S-box protein [Spirochaetaceae bacterium]